MSQSGEINLPGNSQMDNSTPRSYSTALIQQKHPSKRQAIIFNSIEDAKIQDYLLPLGKIIHPKNILFCSRLSNNRICLYLSSENIVEKFMTENNGNIVVNNQIIQARRYITPSERIILSNVCPSIPHDVLIKELESMGLVIQSTMSFLKIGAPLPEFSHIMSFRRQIFISPTDLTIPESFLINYDNTSYRIFLSSGNLTCYNCKQNGHTATNCKNPINPNSNPIASTSVENIPTFTPPEISTSIPEPINPKPNPIAPTTAEKNPILNPPEISTITPASVSIQSANPTTNNQLNPKETESESTTLHMNIESSQNSSKRTIDDTLSPPPPPNDTTDKPMFTNPAEIALSPKKKKKQNKGKSLEAFINQQSPPFVLSYVQITDLFENIKSSPDPLITVENYTDNFTALIDMLNKIYPYTQDRSTKTRNTKLRKILLKHLQMQIPQDLVSDTESDSSQTNQ